MIKKVFVALLFLALLVVGFKIDGSLQGAILAVSNGFKAKIVELYEDFRLAWQEHFAQKERIQKLLHANQELQKYKLLYQDLRHSLQGLMQSCKLSYELHGFGLKLTKMLSFQTLGDYTSAWLDISLPANKIYGLLTSKGVAGIVRSTPHGSIAYFNGNLKCSYTVSIGSGARGIATGSGDNRYILVKYIQSYEVVHPKDRVYTNGYDGIFPFGVEVGRVERVWQEGSYKVARVKTAESLQDPLFFWVAIPPSNEAIK